MSAEEAGVLKVWLLVKRGLYYRPDACGYTGIRDNAGRYSEEDAVSRVGDGESGVSMIHETEAPEFTDACYQDLRITHLTKQRDEARTELAAVRAALPDVEPVAWRTKSKMDRWHTTEDKWLAKTWESVGLNVEPLFTHPASEGCPKGWQPIETAPKDGSEILLYGEPNEVPELKPHIAAGHWRSTAGIMAPGIWCWRHSVGPSFKITKWQPLPPAPSIPEGE